MRTLIAVVYTLVLLLALPAAADGQSPGSKAEVKAERAIATFRSKMPQTQSYFEQAHAFVIFPSVTRAGFGFGGAYGKGVVIEADQAIGVSKFWQFTSGIQAGARNFSMIIFFKDREALEYYQSGKIQFLGQAALALVTAGVDGTPAYSDGVAIFTRTRLGLMAEFTISGAKFSYRPIADR